MATQEAKITASSTEFVSFKETSPENKYPVRDKENKKLEAHELFTLFTANIIKEDVTFTR